jgi:hypothetical protein
MALSVKRFIHEIGCPEPSNQVSVNYHATSADELCAGNGTLSAIFAEAADLSSVVDGAENANAGEGGVCAEGMDVVFVLDYTGSMSGAISGIKTGISNLVTAINNESGGDYRLSLVLYDEDDASSPNYALSGYYQNLPSSQKINTASPDQSGYNLFFTCVEKMNTVGNSTSFTNALNAIDGSNSSTEMSLGNGQDADEPAGRCIYEVVANGFAGSFRSGVQKLIILITDNVTSETATWWQNTLTPAIDFAGAQLMLNTSRASSYGNQSTTYQYAVDNTQPTGSAHYSLNFNGTWTTGLETSISELCSETFTYTCDDLAIGWYQEVGDSTAYYWDGSSWSTSQNCEYTVTINLSESINNATLQNISSSHAYYQDANTLSITGPAGTNFTYTATINPDANYQLDNITDVLITINTGNTSVVTYTDGGENTPLANELLAADEFQVSGQIAVGGGEITLDARGTTSQTQYNYTITVISDIENTGVDPNGSYTLSGVGFSGTSYQVSQTFTGAVGSEYDWYVAFTPNPSDYSLSISNSGQSGGGTEVSSTTVNSAGIGGTLTMPSGGGSVQFTPNGSISQPTYTLAITATENITGAHISSGSGIGEGLATFTGYTGATNWFAIHVDPDDEYNEPSVTGVRVTGANPEAITDTDGNGSTMTINSAWKQAEGYWVMPSGGGDATVEVLGSAGALRTYGFTITINDPYDDTANWQSITLTGTAGQTVTGSRSLQNTQADTTYTVTGVSDDSSALTVTNTGTDLDFSVVMPSGGGSATVTVSGANTLNQYDYTVAFILPTTGRVGYNFDDTSFAGQKGANSSQTQQNKTVTGTAGQQITVTPNHPVVADADYTLTDISVTESSANTSLPNYGTDSGETGDGQTQVHTFTPSVVVTIPTGGGSSTVNCSATATLLEYGFQVNAVTDSSTSYVAEDTCTGGPGSGASTGTGGPAAYITFTGQAGTQWQAEFPAIANNTTDYRSEINSWSLSPNIATYLPLTEGNSYCGAGYDYLGGTFTMPSLDSRTGLTYNSSDLTIDDTVNALTHRFTLSSTDSISNVSVNSSDATQTFDGSVGQTFPWTSTYSASSGYTFNITSVTKSGSNSGSVSVTDSTGSNIGGTITMPSGGGSATVSANGTSSQITYTFTVTFSESISNAAWRSTGTSTTTRTVTLAPGASTTITEWLDTSSGYEFSSTSVSDNHSGLSGGSATSGSTSREVSITVTMPSGATGNQSGTVSVTGSTTLIQRTLTVTHRETITGAYISSGSGAGSLEVASATYTGVPGTTGSRTLYLLSESGYQNPSISSITRSNTSVITAAADTSGSGAGYDEWYYNYTIPDSNTSAIITVNGTVSVVCSCTMLAAGVPPSTYNGTNGRIDIVVNDTCLPSYSWTLNGLPVTPTATGPLEYTITGLSAGIYSLVLTDSQGCQDSKTVGIANPSTTTQAETYTYYTGFLCDEAGDFVFRSTTNWPIGAVNTTGGQACLFREVAAQPWDFTITGLGNCDQCIEAAP